MIFENEIINTEMKVPESVFWYQYHKKLDENWGIPLKEHLNRHAHVVRKNAFKAKRSDYKLREKMAMRNEELYLWKTHFR